MEALKVTTALPLDDPKFEYKLFIIIKRVMGHLDAQHQALYGEQFVMALTTYPMRSPIQLAPPLAQAWLASLTSTQYALTESDKQALKHYCLAWLQYHHLGEVNDHFFVRFYQPTMVLGITAAHFGLLVRSGLSNKANRH